MSSRLCAQLRRAEAGERDPFRSVDRLAGGIQQHARGEPGADENLRRRGGGESAKQVVVLVADGVAGIAAEILSVALSASSSGISAASIRW